MLLAHLTGSEAPFISSAIVMAFAAGAVLGAILAVTAMRLKQKVRK